MRAETEFESLTQLNGRRRFTACLGDLELCQVLC
jgi:hypothetical protein